MCAEELQHGTVVWRSLAERGALGACLEDAQVCAYLAALGSVQLVACLLSSGAQAAAGARAQCDAAWSCTAGARLLACSVLDAAGLCAQNLAPDLVVSGLSHAGAELRPLPLPAVELPCARADC